jgi:hypothetical protein
MRYKRNASDSQRVRPFLYEPKTLQPGNARSNSCGDKDSQAEESRVSGGSSRWRLHGTHPFRQRDA